MSSPKPAFNAKRRPGRKPMLSKKAAGPGDAVAAEPAEELLAAMRRKSEAEDQADDQKRNIHSEPFPLLL